MNYKAKDIAKELGVSPATVSLVINGKPGVGDKLRQEIINKIEEMNCSYLLKEEIVGKGNIGFIIYKSNGAIINEFPFFSFLIENINRNIKKYNYQMNMIYLESNMTVEEQRQSLESNGCRGYIVYAVEMHSNDLDVFKIIKEPYVFLDNSFPMNAVDTVSIDNYLGVFQAIEHLYKNGHRRLGYIRSKIKIQSFDERFEAFMKSLKMFCLELNDVDIMEVGYLEKETEGDVIEYLKKAQSLPTAFFADNDLLACRAIQGMKRMEYKVPDDISIVGFDNRPICDFTDPAVTTIAIPRDDMGYAAVEMLMTRLEGDRKCSTKTMISTFLIKRASVIEKG